MKYYRCPWCGEETLTSFQKNSRRTHNFGIHKIKNTFWFTCPSCKKQVDHVLSPRGKKYEDVLIFLILSDLVLLLVFTGLQIKILMLTAAALLGVSAVLLIVVYSKYTEFVKFEGEKNKKE